MDRAVITMPRSVRQALASIRGDMRAGTVFMPGWCLQKTRQAYLIERRSSDAIDAWLATRYRFDGLWIPGAFMWWRGGAPDPQTGKRHGHVAIMARRKGELYTVDYPTRGAWNRTTVKELEAAWTNIEFVGTSLDINGVKVRTFTRIIRRWHHG